MVYTAHGILQARILEWGAFPFSRGSSQPRDRTQVSRIAGGFFASWATREAQQNWQLNLETFPEPVVKHSHYNNSTIETSNSIDHIKRKGNRYPNPSLPDCFAASAPSYALVVCLSVWWEKAGWWPPPTPPGLCTQQHHVGGVYVYTIEMGSKCMPAQDSEAGQRPLELEFVP